MAPATKPLCGVTGDPSNPQTLASAIIIESTIILALTFLHLSLRLYATLRVTRSAGPDDFISILAFILLVAYTGLVVGTRQYAGHESNIPLESCTEKLFKIGLVDAVIGTSALFFSKLSILLLFFRLFSSNRRTRYLIYFGIAFATTIAITDIAVDGALCIPRRGESFNSSTVISRCAHQGVWAVVQSTAIVVLNLFIFYLPIPIIWRLKLSLKTKLGVLGIFMTSLL